MHSQEYSTLISHFAIVKNMLYLRNPFQNPRKFNLSICMDSNITTHLTFSVLDKKYHPCHLKRYVIISRFIDKNHRTWQLSEVLFSLWCSEYTNEKLCRNACHRITGQKCFWKRGENFNEGNVTGHLYSTCTLDIEACNDGLCDSLEKKHESLCPQDCFHKGIQKYFESLINKLIFRENTVILCNKWKRRKRYTTSG